MSGRIPQNFISDLLERTDLVELIGSRVELKRSGRNNMGCCPFHNEKTPSFSVSTEKQLYHCFGCGVSGNAISFVMEYDRLDFVAAIEELAAKAGMEVPRDEHSSGPDLRPLYDCLARCTHFFSQQLRGESAKTCIDYLKQRGVSGEIAQHFQLGYAPEGWDNLLQAEGRSSTASEQLHTTGMSIKKEHGGFYDRFRERLMFPIIDRRGRTIAFGGRMLGKGEPKYLNSPETPIFHKGAEVYGLYQAQRANKHLQRLLVVEGYMDVVALAQYGVEYAVATLGTALSARHLRLLYRHCNRLVFCFDGDRAGRAAAWKALLECLAEIRDIRQANFLFLPDGEDPDTLIRSEGQAAFERRIDQAMPLSEYLLKHLGEDCDLTSIDGRARLAHLAKPLLARISDPVYRELLNQQVQQLVGTSQRLVEKATTPSKRPLTHPKAARLRTITPMRKAVALLIQYPPLAQQLDDWAWLKHLGADGGQMLHEILQQLEQNPHLSTASLLELWRDTPSHKHLVTLAGWETGIPAAGSAAEFKDAIAHIARGLTEKRLDKLLSEAKLRPLTSTEKTELRQLLADKTS